MLRDMHYGDKRGFRKRAFDRRCARSGASSRKSRGCIRSNRRCRRCASLRTRRHLYGRNEPGPGLVLSRMIGGYGLDLPGSSTRASRVRTEGVGSARTLRMRPVLAKAALPSVDSGEHHSSNAAETRDSARRHRALISKGNGESLITPDQFFDAPEVRRDRRDRWRS